MYEMCLHAIGGHPDRGYNGQLAIFYGDVPERFGEIRVLAQPHVGARLEKGAGTGVAQSLAKNVQRCLVSFRGYEPGEFLTRLRQRTFTFDSNR